MAEGADAADAARAEASLERVFSTAEEWLTENSGEPFFLFIHTYEAHTPYTSSFFTAGLDPGRIGPVLGIDHLPPLRSGQISPTEAEREYGTALYDGDIRSADDRLGGLIAHLEALGIADRVALIVTSDHGEELGDNYLRWIFGHGHPLRDDLIRTPLVVRDPTGTYPERRVRAQVAQVDVMPTVCDLLHVDPGSEVAGRSLLPLMRGEEEANRVAFAVGTKKGPKRASIQNGRYKLIAVRGPTPANAPGLGVELPEYQLYDLDADPGETRNIAAAHPKVTDALAFALDCWLVSAPRPGADPLQPQVIDDDLRARLESLGYTD